MFQLSNRELIKIKYSLSLIPLARHRHYIYPENIASDICQIIEFNFVTIRHYFLEH